MFSVRCCSLVHLVICCPWFLLNCWLTCWCVFSKEVASSEALSTLQALHQVPHDLLFGQQIGHARLAGLVTLVTTALCDRQRFGRLTPSLLCCVRKVTYLSHYFAFSVLYSVSAVCAFCALPQPSVCFDLTLLCLLCVAFRLSRVCVLCSSYHSLLYALILFFWTLAVKFAGDFCVL